MLQSTCKSILWWWEAFCLLCRILDGPQHQSSGLKITKPFHLWCDHMIMSPTLRSGWWHELFVWSTRWLGGCCWWGPVRPTNIVLLINPLAVLGPPSLGLMLSKSPPAAILCLYCQLKKLLKALTKHKAGIVLLCHLAKNAYVLFRT